MNFMIIIFALFLAPAGVQASTTNPLTRPAVPLIMTPPTHTVSDYTLPLQPIIKKYDYDAMTSIINTSLQKTSSTNTSLIKDKTTLTDIKAIISSLTEQGYSQYINQYLNEATNKGNTENQDFITNFKKEYTTETPATEATTPTPTSVASNYADPGTFKPLSTVEHNQYVTLSGEATTPLQPIQDQAPTVDLITPKIILVLQNNLSEYNLATLTNKIKATFSPSSVANDLIKKLKAANVTDEQLKTYLLLSKNPEIQKYSLQNPKVFVNMNTIVNKKLPVEPTSSTATPPSQRVTTTPPPLPPRNVPLAAPEAAAPTPAITTVTTNRGVVNPLFLTTTAPTTLTDSDRTAMISIVRTQLNADLTKGSTVTNTQNIIQHFKNNNYDQAKIQAFLNDASVQSTLEQFQKDSGRKHIILDELRAAANNSNYLIIEQAISTEPAVTRPPVAPKSTQQAQAQAAQLAKDAVTARTAQLIRGASKGKPPTIESFKK